MLRGRVGSERIQDSDYILVPGEGQSAVEGGCHSSMQARRFNECMGDCSLVSHTFVCLSCLEINLLMSHRQKLGDLKLDLKHSSSITRQWRDKSALKNLSSNKRRWTKVIDKKPIVYY